MTCRLRNPFRRLANLLRDPLHERSEILQKDLPRRQILAQTFRVTRPSQAPPKPDPIKSAQHAHDTISISVHKCLHALLLGKEDGFLTNQSPYPIEQRASSTPFGLR